MTVASARRPVLVRPVAVLVMLAALIVSSAVGAAASPTDVEMLAEQLMGRHAATVSAGPVRDLDPNEPAVPAEPTVFATVGEEELVLPGEVRKVGFHESSDGGAIPMDPVGRLDVNLNEAGAALPAVSGGSESEFMVLPTRNRAGGATTAVDISMTHGEQVLSPIDGTVAAVSDYNLYGRTTDVIVEIIPAGSPDMVVRVMHIEDVQVEVGDNVTAGQTRIADSARQLPFGSQIDRYAGPHPHVHIDVQES